MTAKESERIVILGAGVAGLRVAQRLGRRLRPSEAHIILIDENDYHQYLYRIHEVCNLEYEKEDIIVPLSRLLDKKVDLRQASVQDIDTEKKIIYTDKGEYSYDICVIALGSHVTYFGIEGLKENSMTLNSFEAAKDIRARIHELFENASETGRIPKILIGGGGFTGVELAGELSDCIPILCERHNLDYQGTCVTIVEALPTILQGWNEKQVLLAQKILRERGVELILDDPVSRVTNNKVEMKSGKILEPDLFIWTGGVRGDPACGLDFQLKGHRISIDEYCRAEGYEDIFVAGDSACAVDAESGMPMPPTAHIAMVQGDIVAENIIAMLNGSPMKKYIYNRAGEIVTLGKTNAVGDLFGFKFSGVFAKFMKKIVHWWYIHSIGGFSLLLENL
ncbi:MAG: NAD(P)/FAD-dependent oxidoreductase [Candidatus Bathyarchaeota archaeon]|jgi:NADH dehydrogenase